MTVFDGDDKIKTYLSPLDEPHEVAEELLEQLCGSQAVRLYRRLCTALEPVGGSLLHESTLENSLPKGKRKESVTDRPIES